MILRLSLHIPEDVTFIRTTRLLSRCLLEDMKANEGDIQDVEMLVSELCSNVVRHAKSQAPHFLMTLEYYPSEVVVTVRDEGQGFRRDDVLPVGSARSDGTGGERFGGYGLSLVEKVADTTDFTQTDPRGTTVRVTKSLSYATPEAADAAMERNKDNGGVVSADRESGG